MQDIITFGSATKDIFLKATKDFKVIKNKSFVTGKGVCFNLGSKIELEEIFFTSGGGGTNTAATFANQGFKVSYCGSVGNDFAGREIMEELKKMGVSTDLVVYSDKKATNHSIVITGTNDERTILVYRGASEALTEKTIPWDKLDTKWFYIAPLSGELCSVFGNIIDFAVKNKIKVALNPGQCQLNLPKNLLLRNLSRIDILILNQEEASLLTGMPFKKEKEIFAKIDQMCPGIAIMTKGEKGVVLSDGKHLYRAGVMDIDVVDRTGAGDSFASGFVSGYIQSNGDVTFATQLGIANSQECLKALGAKPGLLKKDDKFVKVEVTKEECSQNGPCVCKSC